MENGFRSKLWNYLVNDSIPAQAAKSAWSGVTYPGDVMAGKAAPDDIGRTLDFAGVPMLGSMGIKASPNEIRMGVKLVGGGEAPPTQTGWTFRDVKKPELSPSEQKRWDGDYSMSPRTETVPIRRLYATQDDVNPDFATTETSSGMLPNVIRKNGEMFVMDGHHRLTRLSEEGVPNARVNFFDFDSPEPAATPLLQFDPMKRAKDMSEVDALLRELLGGEI